MPYDRADQPPHDGLYRQIFEEAPVAYHFEDSSGHLQDVNRAWLELLGYERDDVVGRHISDFIAPEFHDLFRRSVAQVQRGETLRGKFIEMVRSNGTRLPVEVDVHSDSPQFGDAGRIYAVIRDVSRQPRDARERSNLARRHELILEAAPGAIVGFDAAGLVTFANPATEKITGWSQLDLQGLSVHETLHRRMPDGPDNPTTDTPLAQAIANQRDAHGETWFQCRDGSFIPVAYGTQPAFPEGIYEGGVLSFKDISERFVTQEKLQQSEERFRNLFENAPVALWRDDFSGVKAYLDDLTRNGVTDLVAHFRAHPDDFAACAARLRVENVNQATLDMHGASCLADLTENPALLFSEDSINSFLQDLVALAGGAVSTEALTTMNTLDGEVRHVLLRIIRDPADEDMRVVYIAVTDLTESRRMEDLNTRLGTAIEQTGDSVLITDHTGVIEYCNPAFEAITGYRRQEVVGKTPRVIKSGFHDRKFFEDLWETITAGKVWVGQFTNRRKDGEIYRVEGSISPVFDSDGHITNFVSVKRDVTLQLETEQRLAQAQKMEAVGQLAGGVAHDFNNILHAMLGHLEFANDEELPPEETRHELKHLRGSVERASQLTRQLLAFSRRQVLELKDVDANDLIAQLLKMMRRVIGEDIELDFRPGRIDHEIHVDPGQIEQVLLNLCLNAQDAMPDGGTLRIATYLEDLDENYLETNDWVKPGRHVRIAVSDNGTGIAPNDLPQIFEPFFTTKESGRGTGLGLATVYGTIKQHGGVVLVESELGQGTTFSILLPATSTAGAATVAAPERSFSVPGGTETILLAEDDDSVRGVISRILSRAGYQVLEAQDGQEALRIVGERGEEIDLALLDLVMPLISGPEVAETILAGHPAVKILYNTGYSEDAIRGRISPTSVAPLLMKPHDPRALLTSIRNLLDGASPG